MALPPKGDPRRPLHLAVRSARSLGGVCLLLGACSMLPWIVGLGRSRGPTPTMTAASSLMYFLPGAAYFVAAAFLARRQFWALIVALVLASMQAVFMFVVLAALLVFALRSAGQTGWVGYVAAAVGGAVLLALLQLIYYLILSFEAIRHVPPEEERGFEPVMAIPLRDPPVPGDDRGPA